MISLVGLCLNVDCFEFYMLFYFGTFVTRVINVLLMVYLGMVIVYMVLGFCVIAFVIGLLDWFFNWRGVGLLDVGILCLFICVIYDIFGCV